MASSPEKTKKSLKIVIIITSALILLLGAAGGAWVLFFSSSSGEEGSVLGKIKGLWAGGKKKPGITHGSMHKMEPFLVNLADPGQLRYLKVTLHVESNQEKVSEEYEKRVPQLRDAILIILSGKCYKDIMNPEGKTVLREEIKGKLNQLLITFKVQNIYFTEFVVQ